MDNSDLVKSLSSAPVEAGAVTILYFARLKEAFGRGSERLALPSSVATVGALREFLRDEAVPGRWSSLRPNPFESL